MEAQALAEEIIKKVTNKGCDAAEVFIKESKGISVEAKEGRVEALEASKDFGIAIKVIKKRKLGFAFTTDPSAVNKAIDKAVDYSDWTADDEYIGIPDNMPASDVTVFDEHIRDISDEEVIKNALLLEEIAVNYDTRIKRVRKAAVNAGTGNTTIMNSKGVNASYKSTFSSASVTAMAQGKSGDSQVGWDYAGSRRIRDINLKSVGEGAAMRALELLDSRKISAVKVPVILSPYVAVDFLEILSSSLSAEAVQKRRSFLIGKTGKQIISPIINIIDDATRPWGTGTSPVDDEGVPTRNKTLISNGVLNGYIHNTYTAKKDGVMSTGNASRGSSKSLPGVGVTNFYIDTDADIRHNDLQGSLKKGLVILGAMGVHTANPVSGDFSVGISGIWIENGKPLYPVREAVISGNILDLFKKIEAVGNDLKFYGSVGAPSLLIRDMDISA